MQTLDLLNYPVAGEKFPDREPVYLNPKGFYELDSITMFQGIHDDSYKGMAVKLFGPGLVRTDRHLINKVIVVDRNPIDCQHSLLASFEHHLPGSRLRHAVEAYDLMEEMLHNFLEVNHVPVLRIRYEDLIKDPEKEISKVAKFVGVVTDITKAVDNIRS